MSKTKAPIPQAFPLFAPVRHPGGATIIPGMDLRDYIATAVLQGMLAHSKRYDPRPGASLNWHDAIAEEAYQIADAMLAEREKGGAS